MFGCWIHDTVFILCIAFCHCLHLILWIYIDNSTLDTCILHRFIFIHIIMLFNTVYDLIWISSATWFSLFWRFLCEIHATRFSFLDENAPVFWILWWAKLTGWNIEMQNLNKWSTQKELRGIYFFTIIVEATFRITSSRRVIKIMYLTRIAFNIPTKILKF